MSLNLGLAQPIEHFRSRVDRANTLLEPAIVGRDGEHVRGKKRVPCIFEVV